MPTCQTHTLQKPHVITGRKRRRGVSGLRHVSQILHTPNKLLLCFLSMYGNAETKLHKQKHLQPTLKQTKKQQITVGVQNVLVYSIVGGRAAEQSHRQCFILTTRKARAHLLASVHSAEVEGPLKAYQLRQRCSVDPDLGRHSGESKHKQKETSQTRSATLSTRTSSECYILFIFQQKEN